MTLARATDSETARVPDRELPHVAIILLNWNQPELTIECLESLFRLDYPRFTVVVCDNASTDGSQDRLREWAHGSSAIGLRVNPELAHLSTPAVAKPVPMVEYSREEAEAGGRPLTDARLVVIHAGENLGFTGGNNAAMRYVAARGDIPLTWILNNDTVVASDSLRHLVAPIMNSGTVGAVGATMFEYREPTVIQAAAGGAFSPRQLFPSLVGQRELDSQERPRVDFISGACFLARTADLVKVRMFDEVFYIYGEDVDLSLKIERLPSRLVYAPEARIWHRGGGEQGYGNPKHDYYTTRNTLLLIRKYYPSFRVPALLYMLYRVFSPKIVRGQRSRLAAVARAWRDFSNGTFGKVSI